MSTSCAAVPEKEEGEGLRMKVIEKRDNEQELKYVRLQVSPSTHRALRLLAARDEKSISKYTRELVTRAVAPIARRYR